MQTLLNGGWGQVIVILAGIAFGVLFSNSRITDLRSHLDKRIDDSNAALGKRMDESNAGLGKRIDDSNISLRDFIRSEINRLEDRLKRLEHPIFRP